MGRWTVVCLLVASPLVSSRVAQACGNEVFREIDVRTMLLVRAERALRRGDLEVARRAVIRAFPALRDKATMASVMSPNLLRRAQLLAALATVRSDGRMAFGSNQPGKTAEQRTANLEWAVKTLRGLDRAKPNNPALQTALGEALTKLPGKQKEALSLLSGLASRDLITTAQGYAALARLYAAAGFNKERAAAVQRCLAWSHGAQRAQCVVANDKIKTASSSS